MIAVTLPTEETFATILRGIPSIVTLLYPAGSLPPRQTCGGTNQGGHTRHDLSNDPYLSDSAEAGQNMQVLATARSVLSFGPVDNFRHAHASTAGNTNVTRG
jgi:hypothetical protein